MNVGVSVPLPAYNVDVAFMARTATMPWGGMVILLSGSQGPICVVGAVSHLDRLEQAASLPASSWFFSIAGTVER